MRSFRQRSPCSATAVMSTRSCSFSGRLRIHAEILCGIGPAGERILTSLSCSSLRSRSRASAGETISYGVFHVRTYAKLPTGPLQANGVRQAISWQRPMRVRRRDPAAERTAHSGSGKTKSRRRGKPGSVSRSISATRTANLETGCSTYPNAAAQGYDKAVVC